MVYVIGGTDGTHSATDSAERFEMVVQEWDFIAKLNYPRSKTMSVVSYESNTIYIAGGAGFKSNSEIIESYNPRNDYWQQIEVSLDFRLNAEKSHMMVYNEDTLFGQNPNDPSSFDQSDKLLFVHYDNIVYPVPDIYFLSIGHGVIEELKYDKTNSVVSTFHKRRVLYDKQTKKILAFSASNYTVVDYMDITDEF